MSRNDHLAAIRSTSMSHLDPEMRTVFEEEKKTEDKEMRALQEIAALESHPGWKLVKEQFLSNIEEYRSGRKLGELLKDMTLTDAQIGQATRTINLVAEELTCVLNSVTLAVGEIERRKEEERNATRQNMARRT